MALLLKVQTLLVNTRIVDIEEIYRRRAFLYISTIDESMMVTIFTKQEKGKHFILLDIYDVRMTIQRTKIISSIVVINYIMI
jgi:hypothetical protein